MEKPDIIQAVEREGFVLKKKGRSYWISCPFHSEKTPSCKISPEKQSFYCFGCGEGGDVIKLVMKLHNLSFGEALVHLGMNDKGKPRPPADPVHTRKQKLIESFRQWEKKEYRELCARRLQLVNSTRDLQTMEQVEAAAAFLHELPEVERLLDILWAGSDEDKYELFKLKGGLP